MCSGKAIGRILSLRAGNRTALSLPPAKGGRKTGEGLILSDDFRRNPLQMANTQDSKIFAIVFMGRKSRLGWIESGMNSCFRWKFRTSALASGAVLRALPLKQT